MPPFPELKDISPPIPPPFSAPEEVQALIWQAFGGLTALVLLAALWLWWRWRARRAKAPPLPRAALDDLRHRLSELRPRTATMAPAVLGQHVGDAIRSYLQREHGLLARYRTTEELFGTARGARRADAPPPLPFLRPFESVFAQCDTLKFTGAGAADGECSRLIDHALSATDDVRAALAPRPPAVPSPLPPLPGEREPSEAATSEEAAAPPVPPATSSAFPPPLPNPSLGPAPRCTPRSDTFTRPQTAAFARGADVIPT